MSYNLCQQPLETAKQDNRKTTWLERKKMEKEIEKIKSYLSKMSEIDKGTREKETNLNKILTSNKVRTYG